MRQITIKVIQGLPFLLGALLATAWTSLMLPVPLAALVAVIALGIASTALWLLSGLIGPRAMGGRPLQEVIDRATAEALEEAVRMYSRQLRIRPPRLFVAPSPAANAMAMGVGPTATVVVTEGMLAALGVRELRAVVGHELAHIKRGDTSIMATAIAMGGLMRLAVWALILISIVAVWGLHVVGLVAGTTRVAASVGAGLQWCCDRAWIVCDQVTALIAAGVSRQAEFAADRVGAHLAGRGAMLTALCRLEATNGRLMVGGWFSRDYATHPPMLDRVEALREVSP